MTYCVGILLADGIIFASDSRTHAGVDNFSKFCKMSVFEKPGDRVIVMLSSGSLAGTQAVVSTLRQRGEIDDCKPNLWNVRTMFDVATVVTDTVRDIELRDGPYLEDCSFQFDASFIIGGQIAGEAPRLFRTYVEGNFIEAGADTPYFQTGETKYGKPIIDRVIRPDTSVSDAIKCVLVSFDSTMRSNLSVGMPIDLLSYAKGSLQARTRHRFGEGDEYFASLGKAWGEGTRAVFAILPQFEWENS